MTSLPHMLAVIAVAFLVGAVMGAIPSGGMIGEMLILSVFGFPPESLPIIAVISTIIDVPYAFKFDRKHGKRHARFPAC